MEILRLTDTMLCHCCRELHCGLGLGGVLKSLPAL